MLCGRCYVPCLNWKTAFILYKTIYFPLPHDICGTLKTTTVHLFVSFLIEGSRHYVICGVREQNVIQNNFIPSARITSCLPFIPSFHCLRFSQKCLLTFLRIFLCKYFCFKVQKFMQRHISSYPEDRFGSHQLLYDLKYSIYWFLKLLYYIILY